MECIQKFIIQNCFTWFCWNYYYIVFLVIKLEKFQFFNNYGTKFIIVFYLELNIKYTISMLYEFSIVIIHSMKWMKLVIIVMSKWRLKKQWYGYKNERYNYEFNNLCFVTIIFVPLHYNYIPVLDKNPLLHCSCTHKLLTERNSHFLLEWSMSILNLLFWTVYLCSCSSSNFSLSLNEDSALHMINFLNIQDYNALKLTSEKMFNLCLKYNNYTLRYSMMNSFVCGSMQQWTLNYGENMTSCNLSMLR